MGRKKQTPQFVLCIRNEGCDDLELRKVYQVLPDASATEEGYLRLIDTGFRCVRPRKARVRRREH